MEETGIEAEIEPDSSPSAQESEMSIGPIQGKAVEAAGQLQPLESSLDETLTADNEAETSLTKKARSRKQTKDTIVRNVDDNEIEDVAGGSRKRGRTKSKNSELIVESTADGSSSGRWAFRDRNKRDYTRMVSDPKLNGDDRDNEWQPGDGQKGEAYKRRRKTYKITKPSNISSEDETNDDEETGRRKKKKIKKKIDLSDENEDEPNKKLKRKKSAAKKQKVSKRIIHKCDACFAEFTCNRKFTVHMHNDHPGHRPHICEKCQRTYATVREMMVHQRICLNLSKHVCEQCDKKFLTDQKLKRHITIHTGEKHEECEICKRRFRDVNTLKEHITAVHKKEGKHSCTECEKKFISKWKLEQHVKIHTGERPFGCDTCGKRFKVKRALEDHILIHKGVKPFGCPLCSSRYARSFILKDHLKGPHGQSEEVVTELMRKVRAEIAEKGQSTAGENNPENMLPPLQRRAKQKKIKASANDDGNIPSIGKKSSITQVQTVTNWETELATHNLIEINQIGYDHHQPQQQPPMQGDVTYYDMSHQYQHVNYEPMMQLNHAGQVVYPSYNPNQQQQPQQQHYVHQSDAAIHWAQSIGTEQDPQYYEQSQMLALQSSSHVPQQIDNTEVPKKAKRPKKPNYTGLLNYQPTTSNTVKNDEPKFFCDQCDRKFRFHSWLVEHQLSHSNHRPFICEFCGRGYKMKKELKRHVDCMHTNTGKFACDMCFKTFHSRSDQAEHRRTHTKEKPFKCDQCDSAFARLTNLQRHKPTHSKERPFACEICSEKFMSKLYLKCHLDKAHLKRITYPCTCCSDKFMTSEGLQKHMKRHENEPCDGRFKCYLCPRRFTQRHGLRYHYKKTHDLNKETIDAELEQYERDVDETIDEVMVRVCGDIENDDGEEVPTSEKVINRVTVNKSKSLIKTKQVCKHKRLALQKKTKSQVITQCHVKLELESESDSISKSDTVLESESNALPQVVDQIDSQVDTRLEQIESVTCSTSTTNPVQSNGTISEDDESLAQSEAIDFALVTLLEG